MKILLLTGMSGAGKTSIAQKLCEDKRYNFINSYTDRQMRKSGEFGHIFVESNHMDLLLSSDDIVAQTKIEKNRYCSLKSQFDDNKVNVYIVDINGINDTMKAFPYAEYMTILIKREKIEVDCVRQARDVQVPVREDVDFLIENNYKIESAVNTIKALVGFDFFTKPSHTIQTIEDKLDYIDKQYRYLDETRKSLLTQFWYQEQSTYKKVCKYVEEKVNEYFDFNITIVPDEEPDFDEEYLCFNIIGDHKEDATWTIMNSLTERLSYYARTYCQDNNISNAFSYRIRVAEHYIGEDDVF